MNIGEAAAEAAGRLSLPPSLVEAACRAYWKAVRVHVSSLPLKEGLGEGEKPHVNLPSLGKLYVPAGRAGIAKTSESEQQAKH